MRETVVNDKVRIIQEDDHIFKYIAINNCTLDIDTLKEMTIIGDTWCEEKLCANLVDIRDLLFIDSKTRAYAAAQYRPHVAGQALVIDSKISSYFANIFLKFSQPKVPTKLFTNEVDALAWLGEQIEKRRKAQNPSG
jgi:hypothetical protein